MQSKHPNRIAVGPSEETTNTVAACAEDLENFPWHQLWVMVTYHIAVRQRAHRDALFSTGRGCLEGCLLSLKTLCSCAVVLSISRQSLPHSVGVSLLGGLRVLEGESKKKKKVWEKNSEWCLLPPTSSYTNIVTVSQSGQKCVTQDVISDCISSHAFLR